MTEKEKTALIAGEISLPSQIGWVITRLQQQGVSLDFLPEVLAKITDELIANRLENPDATS